MAGRNQVTSSCASRIRRSLAASFLACASLGSVVAPGGPALAAPPDPADPFRCHATDGGVLLEWSFVFVAPIRAYVVFRDAEPIAKLPPEDTSYFDEAAPAGEHTYALHAVNFTGEIFALAECRVAVPQPGLRCTADENLVKLEWGPILIDVLILKFRVTRNGEEIASVPPDQLSYLDVVPDAGGYAYRVYAVTAADSEFLVGACRVLVPCFGLRTEVSELDVKLSWDHVPLPAIALAYVFIVSRDGVAIARTEETSYKDTVPAPGRYTYRVELVFANTSTRPTPPNILIGSCVVAVPGPIPAPRDLTCRVGILEPSPLPVEPFDPAVISPTDPGAIDTDGDGVVDSVFPAASVHLSWSNPIAYDKILISRNGLVIATLLGDETSFTDRVRAGGVFAYEVRGVVENLQSEAAACTVEIPPPFIPPPQELTCVLVDVVPVDPTNTSAGTTDGPIVPLPVVILRWWNPITYSSLAILRDGTEIARLPGDSMGYRDPIPPPGPHVYGIYGVAPDGRRSRTVECRVGGEPVPPVRDLQCVALLPAPGDILPPEPVPSAFLKWENGARYDAILIGRNGALVAHLDGAAESFTDAGLPAGVYLYEVTGVLGGQMSPPTSCQVTIPGPPSRNLLYFTRVLSPDDSVPLDDPSNLLPSPAGNRLTCLADNVSPVQGWSFGAASDPRFILPKETDLEGTATAALNGGAGPAFLVTHILEDGTGVTMAVIIDDSSPFETLPPERGHRLLNISYTAGPDGLPGESYPVRYTSRLGDPSVQVLFVVNGFEVVPATLPGRVVLPGLRFQRADSNGDGAVNISDAMKTLQWLFLGSDAPGCIEAANANGTTAVNIADAIYTFLFLFDGGPEPPEPYPGCGFAAAPLGCIDPGACPDEVPTPGAR